MQDAYHISLLKDGDNQVLMIPHELALSSNEVVLRKEGAYLIIEPVLSTSLLSVLSLMQDVEDGFPDPDEGLMPLDDIVL